MFAKQAQLEIFEQQFYDYTNWVNKRNARMANDGYSDIQKQIAEKITNEENIKFSEKIVTKVSLVKNYCPAEEYHQKYLEKR